MPRALLKLLWLKMRGNARRALRVQGNPKRLILLVVGAVAVVLWLSPLVFVAASSHRTPDDGEFTRVFGPLILAAFVFLALFASSGDNAIAFQPAEVDLLFPGPFTRRQLLAYKLVSGMIASIFAATIFSIVFMRHAGSWPNAFVGILLSLWFIQFLGAGIALVKQIIGELSYTRIRRVALAVVTVGVVAALAMIVERQTFTDVYSLARQIHQSTPGRIFLAPFRVFADIVAAASFSEALPKLGVAVAIVAALFFVVLRLDADYLEASLRASERLADRVRRARAGNVFVPAGKAARSRRAPIRGWLGGAGPIAWRQSTTLVRSGRKWLFQLAILLVFAGFIVSSMRRLESDDTGVAVSIGVLAYLTFILASILRFDFRADLDHIETLKSLPLDPRAIALGEILLPVALLSAVQALIVVACAYLFHWPRSLIIATGAALPVLNVLLVGVENLLFLMFPARLANRGVADFSLIGRQLLLFMGKFVIFGVIAGVGAGTALGVRAVTDSWPLGLAAAWLVLAAGATAVVLAAGRAFRAFDVSTDLPPA